MSRMFRALKTRRTLESKSNRRAHIHSTRPSTRSLVWDTPRAKAWSRCPQCRRCRAACPKPQRRAPTTQTHRIRAAIWWASIAIPPPPIISSQLRQLPTTAAWPWTLPFYSRWMARCLAIPLSPGRQWIHWIRRPIKAASIRLSPSESSLLRIRWSPYSSFWFLILSGLFFLNFYSFSSFYTICEIFWKFFILIKWM